MTWATAWDAFTGIGTMAMAGATYWVIRQNKQHHQDSFKPVCVLVPDEGLDALARRGIVQHHEEPNNPTKNFLVRCSVKNIGGGPAVKLRIVMRLPGNPAAKPEVELNPLGSNQCDLSPIRIPAIFHERFNASDYQFAPGEVWELWLVYEDVFGHIFHTRHSKNSQQPWASFGSGDMK
jgi:hypothetical protein